MAVKFQYTVSELARTVDGVLGGIGESGRIIVRGEISQSWFRRSDWGAMAGFTLTEGGSCLTCISYGKAMHRLQTLDSLTGEYFSPPRDPEEVITDGHEVLCEGYLTAYAKGGKSLYELFFFGVTDLAKGKLQEQMRRLERKLAAEGFFAAERKRPVPVNPARVALITSPQGAAIHDFLQNAQGRGLGAKIRLYPVSVQGSSAPEQIESAIRQANRDHFGEVIVLIRGGGSEEDRACFNDERIARAIFTSQIPVLAGIGHEVDFCFADRTADLRASTPTQAAQLLFEPADLLLQRACDAFGRASRAFSSVVARSAGDLKALEQSLRVLSPAQRTQHMAKELGALCTRLVRDMEALVDDGGAAVQALGARAGRSLSGSLKLYGEQVQSLKARLYRAGQSDAARRVRSVRDFSLRLGREMQGALVRSREQLASEEKLLWRAGEQFLEKREHLFRELTLRLEAVSPFRPLERGYAVVTGEGGGVVRDVAAVQPGSEVQVRILNGAFTARVTAVMPEEAESGSGTQKPSDRAGVGR